MKRAATRTALLSFQRVSMKDSLLQSSFNGLPFDVFEEGSNIIRPLQEAAATALRIDRSYYKTLAKGYEERRDSLSRALDEAGFRIYRPNGAYYIMTDVKHFGFSDDVAFALYLVEKFGIATVPGSSFYSRPSLGATKIRFCFPKKRETLEQAAEKLRNFRDERDK